jgi:uroporphyrinogen III methyltransferase / synthase
MKKGIVYLIGAGPGDPGLITVKGVEYLKKADVVIYDQLIGKRILEYVPAKAERIFVGKTGDKHFAEQEEINSLLVEKARQGNTVARLKGGDPFVFGRGGEEADFLKANHVAYEIVPGISSAVAVPAYAGIPVTYRGLSSSVAVVTGHEDPLKKDSSINWRHLAVGVDTLVFLMGMQNLAQIAEKLIQSGRKATTPVAIIKDGTLPVQKTVTGTLGNIAEKAGKAKISAPAVIVVGAVAGLRERLKWFDSMPLFGKTILITRAGPQSAGLDKLLAERGAQTIAFPVIEIKPIAVNRKLDKAILQLYDYDWVLFTSVNGVELFFARLAALGLDTRAFSGIKVGTIGLATCEILAKHGINADFVPRKYTGHDLIAGMAKLNVRGARILMPRADIADNEVTSGLARLGATVDEFAIYRTVLPSHRPNELKNLVSSRRIDIITFTSSSTVTNFLSLLDDYGKSRVKPTVACIGLKTAEAARRAGLKVDIIAKEQTMAGLVRSIEEHFREGK